MWRYVKKDTPILVSRDEKKWHKRHFAEYKDGNVYSYNSGMTSWTVESEYSKSSWPYNKLRTVEVVKAEDIPLTDEWMQEDEWDEIYRKEE